MWLPHPLYYQSQEDSGCCQANSQWSAHVIHVIPVSREHGGLQYIVSKGMHVWIKEKLIEENKSFPTPKVVN